MVHFPRIGRLGLVAAAGLLALALASCSDYGGVLPKQMRPLESKTRDLVDRKGMAQTSPMLIRIFKEEATLEVWKLQKSSGRYALLKEYEICAWSGVLGPKIREGDRQAPEGFYTIRPAQMNPNSDYYLAFNMGYPNEFDRSLGRTGSELMVHGACSSRGCYSMTDESIQEIYTLGRLAFQGGQREFQVQAFPFRMTAENMARHRNDPNMPFWLMLKEGYDHFNAIGQPPKVDVCENRYVFNAVPAAGRSFIPAGQCPPMSMPEPIRIALADRQAKDGERMLEIASRLDRREAGNGAAALRLALAMPSTVERSAPLPMSVATVPVSLEPTTTASVGSEPTTSFDLTAPPAAVSAAPAVAVAPAPAAQPTLATMAAPAHVPAARPEPPVAVAVAPTDAPASEEPSAFSRVDQAFLPVPELRSGEIDGATTEAAPPAEASPDAATLEERMLAGSSPADASVANSYAAAEAEDDGLTGMVLKLIRKQQDGAPTP
jgi:murein L,D-transpeptidase YafK